MLKFAESVACSAAAKQIEKAMEPRQLGAGTADGALLVLGVLKGWTEEATKQKADIIDPKQAKLIFSSDLRNAYGQVHRSALLRCTRQLVPGLAAMLAQKWQTQYNCVWQR